MRLSKKLIKIAYQLTIDALTQSLQDFEKSEELEKLDRDKRESLTEFIYAVVSFLNKCKSLDELYLRDFDKNTLQTKIMLGRIYQNLLLSAYIDFKVIENLISSHQIKNPTIHLAFDFIDNLDRFVMTNIFQYIEQGLIDLKDIERYLGSGVYGTAFIPKNLTQQPAGYAQKIVAQINPDEFYFLKWLSQQKHSWYEERPLPRIYDVSTTDGKSATFTMDEVITFKAYQKLLEEKGARYVFITSGRGVPRIERITAPGIFPFPHKIIIRLPGNLTAHISDLHNENYGFMLHEGTIDDPDKWVAFDLGDIYFLENGFEIYGNQVAKALGIPLIPATSTI